MEINQHSRQKKNESNIRDPWNNIKCAHICCVRIPEGEKGIKHVFEEIMAENFPNLKKQIFM